MKSNMVKVSQRRICKSKGIKIRILLHKPNPFWLEIKSKTFASKNLIWEAYALFISRSGSQEKTYNLFFGLCLFLVLMNICSFSVIILTYDCQESSNQEKNFFHILPVPFHQACRSSYTHQLLYFHYHMPSPLASFTISVSATLVCLNPSPEIIHIFPLKLPLVLCSSLFWPHSSWYGLLQAESFIGFWGKGEIRWQ